MTENSIFEIVFSFFVVPFLLLGSFALGLGAEFLRGSSLRKTSFEDGLCVISLGAGAVSLLVLAALAFGHGVSQTLQLVLS